jgi:hypothetical protein
MAEVDTENLVPTSTDMLVGMLGNTDKLVDSNKRWNYADHKGEKNEEDDLDVDVGDFLNKSKKDNNRGASLFTKPDDGRSYNRNNDNKREDFAKHENVSHKSKEHTDPDYDYVTSVTETARDETDTSGLSKKELMLLKLDMLRKLGELKQCGVHLSQNYNLDSELDMMQYEYKLHHDIRSKQNSVQWMSHMMIGIVKGMEMVNDNYNPFDIKLGGLSDKISSDMHNYYAVLGDIYEKYNQPGKQMAPEMRLLLMISGAALGMQVNKITGMGGMSNTVKTEENLNELREKAEADTKEKDYVKKQHDTATQKAADIKMIQEKELEMKRTAKLLDGRNTSNMKKFKENLILSSEEPSRGPDKRDNKRKSNFKQSPKDEEYNDNDDDEENETHHLTQAEIDRVRKMKYMEEQKHLEMLRKTAHAKSEMFRNNMMRNDMDEKRKRDLAKQSQQLDDIIGNIDKIDRNITSADKSSLKKIKPKVNNSISKSLRSVNNTSDNRSTSSSASSISINPKAKEIMRQTADKARKESQKKYSDFSEEPKSKPTINSASKPMKKLVNNNVTKTPTPLNNKMNKSMNTPMKTPLKSPKNTNDKSKINRDNFNFDIKFDEKIEMLLENNGSDFDDMSREEISIGSRDKNRNRNTFHNKISPQNNTPSNSSSKQNTSTSDLLDFGIMSIGSKNKGKKMTINAGKK